MAPWMCSETHQRMLQGQVKVESFTIDKHPRISWTVANINNRFIIHVRRNAWFPILPSMSCFDRNKLSKFFSSTRKFLFLTVFYSQYHELFSQLPYQQRASLESYSQHISGHTTYITIGDFSIAAAVFESTLDCLYSYGGGGRTKNISDQQKSDRSLETLQLRASVLI